VGLALDEPTDKDSCLEVDGIPVIIAKDDESYMGHRGGLRLHYITNSIGSGFTVSRSSAHDFGC
jgi:Fe-S cluster assembly iron-binding protein IscA